jgi:corrinoid protein of di/trimethylamine methyltransferase
MSDETMLKQMAQTIVDGEIGAAEELAHQSLEEGLDPLESINQGYRAGLDEVGIGFDAGEYFLPDLVLAGKTMEAAVAILEPALTEGAADRETLGKVILATVEGDVHTIGKDLVALMLSLNGFKVLNIGHDVPTKEIVDRVLDEKPDLVGLSALLTTTTQAQVDVIQGLVEAGTRDRVKVLVGGAATSGEWADRIGADGYAEDAAAAVTKAKEVLGIG